MSERLVIRNFAGIKEIDIDLGEINVLIGPQATGKSICAKSLYFFKSFLGDLIRVAQTEQSKRQFDAEFLQKFQNYFPLHNLENKDFLLRYEIGEKFIQIEQGKSKPKISYSDYYSRELSSWKDIFRNTLGSLVDDNQTINTASLRRDFFAAQRQNIGGTAAHSQIFIPAGRSFFAILQQSIFSFLSTNNAIDPFLTDFGSFYESIKLRDYSTRLINDKDIQLRSKIDRITEHLLQGKHVFERGTDFLVLPDGRKINVANSSSGQQELLPLALILGTVPFYRLAGRSGSVVYIEEPEAHLFPSAQRSIVDLITTLYNESKVSLQFIITTHSPYILAAFNNLIHAGNLSSSLSPNDTKRLENVVPEEQRLRSEDMRVYYLHDGICDSMISKDTGLIATNALDAVSDELAAQFDSILDIE